MPVCGLKQYSVGRGKILLSSTIKGIGDELNEKF